MTRDGWRRGQWGRVGGGQRKGCDQANGAGPAWAGQQAKSTWARAGPGEGGRSSPVAQSLPGWREKAMRGKGQPDQATGEAVGPHERVWAQSAGGGTGPALTGRGAAAGPLAGSPSQGWLRGPRGGRPGSPTVHNARVCPEVFPRPSEETPVSGGPTPHPHPGEGLSGASCSCPSGRPQFWGGMRNPEV